MSETNQGGKRTGAGRPRDSLGLKRRAAKHAQTALDTLAEIANNPTAAPDVRLRAATAILDCGHGNAPAAQSAEAAS